MIRGGILWLAGVVCGVAVSYWAFTPAVTPGPGSETDAPPARTAMVPAPEVECPAPAQVPESASAEENSTKAAAQSRQPMTGSGEEVFTLYVLDDERHLDPEAGAEPMMTGGGPPATLVCHYQSKTDGSIFTKSSRYDSQLRPLPSCPFELQVPAE